MTETARALVLRTFDYSETSLVVTLFTDRMGLARAIAKGAKRPDSRLYGGLGLFSLSDVTIYPKKSGLDVLSEADLLDGFPGLGDDLGAYFGAHYAAELLLGLTVEGDPCPGAFEAALAALRGLAAGLDPDIALFRFEARMLFCTGHMPRTDGCVSCGKPLPRGKDVGFSPRSGGAFCESCAAPWPETGITIRAGTLSLLSRFADPAATDLFRARIPQVLRRELRRLFVACFQSLMERELRTVKFLGRAPRPARGASSGAPQRGTA